MAGSFSLTWSILTVIWLILPNQRSFALFKPARSLNLQVDWKNGNVFSIVARTTCFNRMSLMYLNFTRHLPIHCKLQLLSFNLLLSSLCESLIRLLKRNLSLLQIFSYNCLCIIFPRRKKHSHVGLFYVWSMDFGIATRARPEGHRSNGDSASV